MNTVKMPYVYKQIVFTHQLIYDRIYTIMYI